jgi:hypothetical protein
MLGVVAEGCADALRQMLSTIIPTLLDAVRSPEVFIRETACFAMGQFSEHCQPEILMFHSTVLPTIFMALDDPTTNVQGTSCYVLEMFCENLQPETLRPFLGPLMQKLVGLLQSPSNTIKEMALSAIAATSIAAERDFIPFAAVSIHACMHAFTFINSCSISQFRCNVSNLSYPYFV